MTHSQGLLNRALIAIITVVLCGGAAVAEDEVTNEACLACHATEGFAGPDGRPLFTNAEAFNASAHGSLPCTACHTDSTSIPHTEKLKRLTLDSCAPCHSDQLTAYRKSIHGQADGLRVKETASCMDCHGTIHAVLPHTTPKSAAHWSNLAATCARCHANTKLTQRFGIPVVRPVAMYLDSAHGRAVTAGKMAAVCSDCHGAHDILPNSDPHSRIWHTNVPETCGKCHAGALAAYSNGVHGKAAARGVREAPVCTDCHGEHRILSRTEPASLVFAANIPRETCGRCHGDERLSRKYGLSMGPVTAFRDSYHGLAIRSGQLTVANCASCHGFHYILPSDDPHSLVNAANLPKTCGECHPGAGALFTLGSVHGAASAIGTLAVYWIRIFYLCLIVGTIGLMAVHNVLDFTHKVRHPEPPPRAVPTGQPERMRRPVRWQHGLTLLSFAVLVYTGFALNYPESWWATPLLRWEGHIAFRGLVHRIAAVILMAGLLWHVVHLAVSRRMRACMKPMWPSVKDLRDALAMLAYYFGRRAARPRMGKFSYTEKAEYWAFLWGTGVMTVTGLMLWFINATLQYLPSWAADAATAIHFYEAILATLSVLVWHFYWVIFDPDVYPVDPTFWNGHPPASRVLERLEGPEPRDNQPPAVGESPASSVR